MNTELILTIIILILTVTITLITYLNSKEREKLVKAILAKDLRELTDNEALEKIKKNPAPAAEPEFQAFDEADETVFDRAIKQQLKDAQKLT